jgi:hypothetical protein
MRGQTHSGCDDGKNEKESLQQQSAINEHASILSETIGRIAPGNYDWGQCLKGDCASKN